MFCCKNYLSNHYLSNHYLSKHYCVGCIIFSFLTDYIKVQQREEGCSGFPGLSYLCSTVHRDPWKNCGQPTQCRKGLVKHILIIIMIKTFILCPCHITGV